MKNNFKKFISILMVAVIFASFNVTFATAAYAMTEAEWASYWSSYNADGGAVHLAPGSDETEMNVSWLGDDAEASPVVFAREAGETEYYAYVGETVSSRDVTAAYRVTLTDLLPGKTYEYYCVSGDYQSQVYTFKTADEGSFSAVLASDIHVSYDENIADNVKTTAYNAAEIFAEAHAKDNNISLLISAGDNADAGLLSEYKGLFANPLVTSIPFAVVCGNHDYKDDVFPYVFNYPNTFNEQAVSSDKNGGDYWFVKGDVLFLMLNSNWISAEDHHTFVEKAVEANPDVKWRVAVMHHDLYGGHLPHRESENELLRMMFSPIFDEFKVDLVFMGHSHVYSRSHVIYDNKVVENLKGDESVTDAQGTIYITTGSTSRPRDTQNQGSIRVAFDYKSPTDYIYDIVEFNEDSIEFTAYVSGQDEPMDNFTIYKTSNDGGHITETDGTDGIVYFISLIASVFRNLGQTFEAIFGAIGIEF